jgi:pimeloyl-ACP methyl ester carboxylesterase
MDTISIWSVTRNVILAAGAIYIALVIILTIFQSKLIFFPIRALEASPAAIELAYETVSFATTDGETLTGWFIGNDKSDDVLLFCHGNAGNISHRLDSIRIFHELGLSVFIFDFRGYGESSGKPSEKGTYLDVEAAWRHLTDEREVDPSHIILFGRSLGASIAAYLAKQRPVRAMIVESAMTSLPDIGAKIYPFLPVRLMCRFEYPTIDYIGEADCPVLVIHSPDDELMPFEHGERLFAVAREPKQFLRISGGHNEGFLLSSTVYIDGLREYISSLR